MQEPVLPGTFLRARAIGLMPMIDQVEVASALPAFGFYSVWEKEKEVCLRAFGKLVGGGGRLPISFFNYLLS